MKAIFAAGLGLGLLAALALIRPAAGLGAETRPEIRYVYYDVPYRQGLSVSDLIHLHTTLFNSQGRALSGITDYLIRYEINHSSPVPGLCSVKSPRVFCECEITLPRLVGAENEPLVRAEFAAELENIRRHELTHCDIAADYADRLLNSYRRFKDMPCDRSAEAVRNEFERIIAECWEAQILFDHSEYGYKDHLDPGDFQRAVGRNYQISPQTRDGSRPDRPDAPEPQPRREPAAAPPPIRAEREPPAAAPVSEPASPTPAGSGGGGIYKDQDGVWRNY